MNSAFITNIRMAVASLRAARLRSFLTMLGIIIGVMSVVTVVSIGQGIKHQVSREIDQLGRDLITIRPGDAGRNGRLSGLSPLSGDGYSGSLTAADVSAVQKTPGVGRAVPLALLNGPVIIGGQTTVAPLVLATTGDFDDLIGEPLDKGEFFGGDLADQPDAAVIGNAVANHLFGEESPLGRSFTFQGRTFFVRGVMKKFDAAPLSLATDFNDAFLVPYGTARDLAGADVQIYEILAKPADPARLDSTVEALGHSLRNAHRGQQPVSVLRQDASLAVTGNILDLLTKLITGVAAISLLVGGIGIMDVMLVSVAERMHEVGLRKALGASNRQIWLQFLTEAVVLSLAGGVLGVLAALLLNFILRVTTSLTPIISWQAVMVSVGVSLVVGVIFGTAPALKAARKDPIEALRNA